MRGVAGDTRWESAIKKKEFKVLGNDVANQKQTHESGAISVFHLLTVRASHMFWNILVKEVSRCISWVGRMKINDGGRCMEGQLLQIEPGVVA